MTSREPLWDQPHLAEDVAQGRYYLPGAPTGKREALITSPREGSPQYLLQMPWPGWAPFVAAVFTAAFFLLLTVKLVWPALACGAVAVAGLLRWTWALDLGPTHPPVDIGGGLRVPVYATGPLSHSWRAMVILMLVAGSVFGCLAFSYLYLWTVSPQAWPARAGPAVTYPLSVAELLVLSSVAAGYAQKALQDARLARVSLALMAGVFLLDGLGHRHAGLAPTVSSYGAIVSMVLALEGFYVAVVACMALYTLARAAAGLIDNERRVTFDNTMLFCHYTVAQSLAGLVLMHAFPRLVG